MGSYIQTYASGPSTKNWSGCMSKRIFRFFFSFSTGLSVLHSLKLASASSVPVLSSFVACRFLISFFSSSLFSFLPLRSSASDTGTFLARWKNLCANIVSRKSIAISRDGNKHCSPWAYFDDINASNAFVAANIQLDVWDDLINVTAKP